MSFMCTTELMCDQCTHTFTTSGERMSDCASKLHFEISLKRKGWKVLYGKYHVCKDCIEHYGIKYLRAKFKEVNNEKS